MNGDTQKIEKLLRQAPRPAARAELLAKLKADLRLPENSGPISVQASEMEPRHGSMLWHLWMFIRSHRLNLGGLAAVWMVILFCRVTLPNTSEMMLATKVDRPSREMFIALAEYQRSLMTLLHSGRMETEDPRLTRFNRL